MHASTSGVIKLLPRLTCALIRPLAPASRGVRATPGNPFPPRILHSRLRRGARRARSAPRPHGVAYSIICSFPGGNALRENALCFVLQPGSLQDVLLHETAVSWLRHRLSRSTPRKCWQESREEYGRRLKRCCEEVNKECDVEGLCKGLPKRMKLLEDKDGDRLRK